MMSEQSFALPTDIERIEFEFPSGDETLVGDLVIPNGIDSYPTILFLAGTGAIDRYQRLVMPDGIVRASSPKGWLPETLARLGVATFAWDKRGVGDSTGGDRQPGDPPGDRDSHASVKTDVDDAESALSYLTQLPQVNGDNVTVMGHSAGVYFASLLAARTDVPTSYILWGGVYRGIVELMQFIYGQTLDYAARGPQEYDFIQEQSPWIYATGLRQKEIVEAARRGESTHEWEHEGRTYIAHLERLTQELMWPLSEQFRNVQRPTLVIHGDQDLNVPVDDAYQILDELKSSGNSHASLVVVPGADHGMRVAPRELDAETRLRERLSFYKGHPVSSFFLHAIAGWAHDQAKLHGQVGAPPGL